VMDIVVADKGAAQRVGFGMSEEDVRTALKHPLISFCTDSPAMAEDGILSQETSHPRAWGSAPRILGHYVREERLLSLEEAIRKMTSLPASRMHFSDRGIVRPGMHADLTVFNPATVREHGVRGPAPLQRGSSVCGRERAARGGWRQDHRGTPRAHPARARLPVT
jgi:N-acyl-D-amino-acid deacylase